MLTKSLIRSFRKQTKASIIFGFFANYYSGIIPEYGKLAADMNGLRNKKGPIELIPSMKSDFENMKLAFAKGPTRAYPDFSPNANPFILVTDFSSKCCAAILSQLQNRQERFIACAASKNNAAQASYPSYKRELLAVIVALKNSNVYYKSVNLFCALTLLAEIT